MQSVSRIKARIGVGDLFEIEVMGGAGPHLDALVQHLKDDISSLSVRDRSLRFTAADAGSVLPRVQAAIRSHGLGVAHVRVRDRTLEDVFIHLTGRGLRE